MFPLLHVYLNSALLDSNKQTASRQLKSDRADASQSSITSFFASKPAEHKPKKTRETIVLDSDSELSQHEDSDSGSPSDVELVAAQEYKAKAKSRAKGKGKPEEPAATTPKSKKTGNGTVPSARKGSKDLEVKVLPNNKKRVASNTGSPEEPALPVEVKGKNGVVPKQKSLFTYMEPKGEMIVQTAKNAKVSCFGFF